MTPLHPHDLARPDATIRYWTGGTAGAPTVVLLHGATLDHRAWSPQVDALQDRFQLVVPDLRAHGASIGHFDFDDAVEDVLALLDKLPARRVVLVGLSLGANIAQAVVQRDPDRVHALVIADATCNTAARQPLLASMTVAALTAQAMLTGDGFAQHAANLTATDPGARAYVLEANAHRSNREPSPSSPRCSPAPCGPIRTTGCRCPRFSSTVTVTPSGTSLPAPGPGRSGSHWPSTP